MYNLEKITIDNEEVFGELKQSFDEVMNKTLLNMQNKGSSEGELKVTVKISTRQEGFKEGADWRMLTKPKFTHRVTSTIQVKDEKTGGFSGDYELVKDEFGDMYLRKLQSDQVTMFDHENEGEYEYEDVA